VARALTRAWAVFATAGLLSLASAHVGMAAGAPSKSEYVKRMSPVGKTLTAALASLQTVTGISLTYPPPPTAARRAGTILAKTESNLQLASKQLAAIKAPAGAAAQHARLVQGTAEFAAELKPLVAKLKAGYLVVASGLLSLKGAVTISGALSTLNRHGYKIGT
jgi:hypothetical protein